MIYPPLTHHLGDFVMSKPVKGNPAVDADWNKFIAEAKNWGRELKNISLKDCRKGAKVLGQLHIATNDAMIERLQQSIGGVIGDRVKKEAKADMA
jgi:hypothetical protein